MIEHSWSVLCNKASFDRDTNNVSLFEVIEQVQIESLQPLPTDGKPLVPFQCELVSLWSRSDPQVPSRGYARVTFQEHGQDPNFTAIEATIGNELPLELTGTTKRLRSRIQVPGFPISRSGDYWLVIEFRLADDPDGWRLGTRLPLQVALTSPG